MKRHWVKLEIRFSDSALRLQATTANSLLCSTWGSNPRAQYLLLWLSVSHISLITEQKLLLGKVLKVQYIYSSLLAWSMFQSCSKFYLSINNSTHIFCVNISESKIRLESVLSTKTLLLLTKTTTKIYGWNLTHTTHTM